MSEPKTSKNAAAPEPPSEAMSSSPQFTEGTPQASLQSPSPNIPAETSPGADASNASSAMVPTAAPTSSSSPLKRAVLVLLVLAAVFAAYSPSLSGEFVWDDEALILNARSIHSLQPLSSYFTRGFWSEDQDYAATNYFRPLVTLSYALDWQLWEGRPQGFHLTNVLVHLINCLLAFLLARKWGARFVPAVAAMAIFGFYPHLTECVAWISGRTDVLAAFFTLLALLAYPVSSGSASTETKADGGGPCVRDVGRAFLAALLALTGLFCKEVAIAGFATMGALEAGLLAARRSKTALKGAVARLFPLALAASAYAAARSSNPDLAHHAPLRFLGNGIASVLAAVGEYVWLTVVFFQPKFQIGIKGQPSITMAILGGAAILAAIALIVRNGVRRTLTAETFPLWVLAVFALLPVCNIVPRDDHTFAAGRFLYFPVFALAIGCAMAYSRSVATQQTASTSSPKRLAAGIAVLAVLAASVPITFLQAGRWADHKKIFGWGCLEKDPTHHLACNLLAEHMIRQGRPDEAARLLRRAREFDGTIQSATYRNYITDLASNNECDALAQMGRYEEALQTARAAAGQKAMSFHITRSATLVVLTLLEMGTCGEAQAYAEKTFPRLSYAQRRMDGFSKTLDAVCPLIDSLGGAYGRPPKDLTEREIDVSIRIGRILKDRFRLTGLYLEVLRRGTFGPNAQSEAALYLEEKGVCPLLEEALGPGVPLPERCAPLPPEILESSAPPI